MEHTRRISKVWLLPVEFGQEKTVMRDIASIADSLGISLERTEDMKTAVAEACINAIEHGAFPECSDPVRVIMDVDDNTFRFRIFNQDQGITVLPETTGKPDMREDGYSRGWGLPIIRGLSDVLEYGQLDGRFYVELIFIC
jgi:serine/threonine-protein kinase RsbW